MVREMIEALAPRSGELAVDCTLGYGGHAQELLQRLLPGGKLIGLDTDPLELPKTEARLRALGFGPDVFVAYRCNFAGLPKVLTAHFSSLAPSDEEKAGIPGADLILADLGASSMQFDDPVRGFSVKQKGPPDMRMNPNRGRPASDLLKQIRPAALAALLADNADEPHAVNLAEALAGKAFATTTSLAAAIRAALPHANKEHSDLSIRRVFQALRIAVNDEFSALETFLRNLPSCLNPGGRVAILTFHSGEDRRVKKAFETALREGVYAGIAREVIRPTPDEIRSNPRSSPAKLRWAIRAPIEEPQMNADERRWK
jgi:16S rRNA (cytosine1402-N4)-methyltransferase